MRLSIIVAVSQNNVIGKNNKLLWHLPKDLKFFKATTMGKPVILGRKTFDSVGKPLPGRINIVVSRKINLKISGCTVVNSLSLAIKSVENTDEVFIAGGGEIYRQALPIADRIYLTRVLKNFEGDTNFPQLNHSEWKIVSEEKHFADEKHDCDFTFTVLDRIY